MNAICEAKVQTGCDQYLAELKLCCRQWNVLALNHPKVKVSSTCQALYANI